MFSDLTVTIWPGSRWTPFIWAMKMAATASYRAVPSMLMVAPTGSTKRVTLLSIPKFSSRQRKVTGSVPALEGKAKEGRLYIVLTEWTSRSLCWSSYPPWCWPGGCPQSSDPGLEDSQEEGEGVFPDDSKIDAGQEDCSMDDEANNYSHHVHAQLPGNHLQILDGNYLTTDQTGNTQGRVPDEMKKLSLLF